MRTLRVSENFPEPVDSRTLVNLRAARISEPVLPRAAWLRLDGHGAERR